MLTWAWFIATIKSLDELVSPHAPVSGVNQVALPLYRRAKWFPLLSNTGVPLMQLVMTDKRTMTRKEVVVDEYMVTVFFHLFFRFSGVSLYIELNWFGRELHVSMIVTIIIKKGDF
jgi:hypothetical protein